jgi:hypothetical protein
MCENGGEVSEVIGMNGNELRAKKTEIKQFADQKKGRRSGGIDIGEAEEIKKEKKSRAFVLGKLEIEEIKR